MAAVTGLAFLLAVSGMPGARDRNPAPGDVIEDFGAVTIQGQPFSLAEASAEHKAIVFVFFSVSCPYSNLFSDRVRELSGLYDKKGVLFVGVYSNRRESLEEALAYAQKHGHRFPTVKDTGRIADLLGARVTPEAFLVDSARRLRYKGQIRSKMGQPYLEEALEAVLAGRPVRAPYAKAFGCFIDRD